VAAVALTVVCIAATIPLVMFEARAHDVGRSVTKSIAAAAFVGVAIARGGLGPSAYGNWMLTGLMLGAAGDIALLV
jgi:hypothetical protein